MPSSVPDRDTLPSRDRLDAAAERTRFYEAAHNLATVFLVVVGAAVVWRNLTPWCFAVVASGLFVLRLLGSALVRRVWIEPAVRRALQDGSGGALSSARQEEDDDEG